MDPSVRLKTHAARVDRRLEELLPGAHETPAELSEAVRYAVLAPGKRLRPALAMEWCAACGADPEAALDAACALEMIHAFSLVHDDLPEIDNDVVRRGRPTTWKKFGPAVGLLAGDGIFALAFMTAPAYAAILGRASWALVRGETLDVLSEGSPPDAATLDFIHANKTGALIEAACEIGALAAGREDIAPRAAAYGRALGLAFQIADDLLDATSTTEQLGKTAGADAARGKLTYPAVHGLDASRARADALVADARAALDGLPGEIETLDELAIYTVARRA